MRAVVGFIAGAAICGVVAARPAEAVLVQYSTAGCFNAPACDPFAVAGASVVSFIPVTGVMFLEPSQVSLGQMTVASAGSGTFAATPFDLFIVQSLPGFGAGQLTAAINGTITPLSSGASVSFSTTSVVLAGVQYTLLNNPLFLPAPSTSQTVSIEAFVQYVPEPSTMLLFGAALVGLATRARRKSQESIAA
jgi:hypothetical protein